MLLDVRPALTNPEPSTPGLAFEDMWPKEDFYGNGHQYDRKLVPEFWTKITRWERFMPKKYVDTVLKDGTKVWAICYGHSGKSGVWPSQAEIIANDYEFTRAEGLAMLKKDMDEEYLPALSRLIKVNVTNYMLSGIAMTLFNMGQTAYRKAHVIASLEKGKYLEACTRFLILEDGTSTNNKARDSSGNLVMQNGLSCRRADEMSLYLTRVDKEGVVV